MRVPPGQPSSAPTRPPASWTSGLRAHFWRGLALAALLGLLIQAFWPRPPERRITQQDIDAAVLKTLETAVLPSPAARAAAAIAPSVVRVKSYADDGKGGEEEHGVGTGVVIVNSGLILTNLHVVAGAQRIETTFYDGSTSPAYVRNTQAENDLAVLQARVVPDDLEPATLRSTAGLRPGDGVVAVGFPFGIGPSVTNGVVSGLGRSFRSPEGKQVIGNLIQFDAAANPGNSGGPLVTLDGQVVGIVTAILNPGEQRTFVGIGFAVPIENAASAVGMHPF
jgi:S1-C subfamily serine protease